MYICVCLRVCVRCDDDEKVLLFFFFIYHWRTRIEKTVEDNEGLEADNRVVGAELLGELGVGAVDALSALLLRVALNDK